MRKGSLPEVHRSQYYGTDFREKKKKTFTARSTGKELRSPGLKSVSLTWDSG